MANFVRSESVVRDAVNFCADSDVIEVSSDCILIDTKRHQNCDKNLSGSAVLLHPVGRRRQRERQGGPHHPGKPLLRGEWVTYTLLQKRKKVKFEFPTKIPPPCEQPSNLLSENAKIKMIFLGSHFCYVLYTKILKVKLFISENICIEF